MRAATLLLSVAIIAGCASDSSLYQWGNYEDSVYSLCRDFEDEELLDQIADLNGHVSSLRSVDRFPPPGMHAHLGYLEYLAGNRDAAVRNFETEKELYPESATFISGLLHRMSGT